MISFAVFTSVTGTADDIVDRHMLTNADRGSYLLAGVLQAVGLALMLFPLRYLYRVVKYRRDELPRGVWPLALYAPLALGIVAVAGALHQLDVVERIANAPALPPEQAIERAQDEEASGFAIAIAIGGSVAALSLAAVLILVNQHGRRAGLLSNFIGIIGIIVGAFFVIGPLVGSVLGPLPIVQWFWLGALALLFLRRWPGGMPPAWESGEAEPWPTAQEIREQRQAEAEEAPDEPEEEEEEPAAAGAPAHPRSKKRKRKRKR